VTQFAEPLLPLLGTKHNSPTASAIDHAKQNKQNKMAVAAYEVEQQRQPTTNHKGGEGRRGRDGIGRLINHLASYLLKTMRLMFS
jgi:hypothetical protein